MIKNESLENNFLATVVQMGKMHLDILKSASTQSAVHKTMNKNIDLINLCADDDKVPTMCKINV